MSCRRMFFLVGLVLALLTAHISPPTVLAAPASTAVVRADVAGMEEEMRQGINAVRRQHGLAPLQADAALAKVAREHSRRMAKAGFFAHEDPQRGSLVDRLKQAGIPYRVAAENLLTTTNIADPVQPAIDQWMQSRGHRANILRPEVTATGVGIWQEGNTFYFTQVFLRPPGGNK